MLKKKRITKAKVSAKIEPEKYFWACDGQILKNLKELAKSLEGMSNEVFGHHANKLKNDFADWVRDIFGDRKLATELKRAKTAKTAAKKVKARIK